MIAGELRRCVASGRRFAFEAGEGVVWATGQGREGRGRLPTVRCVWGKAKRSGETRTEARG